MISMEKKLLPAITTPFSCHLPENSIFGHFSPFVPTHGQPLDRTFAFIDKYSITRCCCDEIFKANATTGYYHLILPHFPWKFNFWPFLAIFHHLCLMVGNPLTPSPFLLTKMLPLGAVAMKSMKRKLLQAITTPFSHHSPVISIFGHFWPFFTICACLWATPWLLSAFMDKNVISGCCCNDICK